MDSVAYHFTPQKRQPSTLDYRIISFISHSSKVMLKVILDKLKPQAREVIAEEQNGFTAGWSTTKQQFNLKILAKKCLEHQQNLYLVFSDFRKTFDSILHASLWATCGSIIPVHIQFAPLSSYYKATSAIQWQHGRMVQSNSWSMARMPFLLNIS